MPQESAISREDDTLLGKIINGALRYAPRKIIIDGKIIFNPPEDTLKAQGYKDVVMVDMPDDAPDGQHYEAQYTDGETQITQSWVLVEDVEEEKPVTLEQRVTQLEQNIAGVIQIATM